MKLFIKKLIGKIWGIYCPVCGAKEIEQGYYGDRSYCPKHPRKLD